MSTIKPPEGFKEIQLPFNIGGFRPGYSHPENLKGLFLKLFQSEDGQRVQGTAVFGPLLVGPPGHAHGGCLAFVLDEAMGTSCWCAGHKVVAEELKYRLKRMLKLEEEARVEAEVVSVDGERVISRGRVLDKDGNVCTESEGLFHILSDKQIERMREALAE